MGKKEIALNAKFVINICYWTHVCPDKRGNEIFHP